MNQHAVKIRIDMFWVVLIYLREQVEVEAFYVQPKSETHQNQNGKFLFDST